MSAKRFPIEWWQDCLRNRRYAYEREVAALLRQHAHVEATRRQLEFEEERLQAAIKAGRDSYSDNFKRKQQA